MTTVTPYVIDPKKFEWDTKISWNVTSPMSSLCYFNEGDEIAPLTEQQIEHLKNLIVVEKDSPIEELVFRCPYDATSFRVPVRDGLTAWNLMNAVVEHYYHKDDKAKEDLLYTNKSFFDGFHVDTESGEVWVCVS